MGHVVNITDRIQFRNLKFKIDRLEGENRALSQTMSSLRNENSNLHSQNLLLKEENDELKRLLKEFSVDITYG